MLVAQSTDRLEVTLGGRPDSGRALDGLGEHRCDLARPFGHQRCETFDVVAVDLHYLGEEVAPADLVGRESLRRRAAVIGSVVPASRPMINVRSG